MPNSFPSQWGKVTVGDSDDERHCQVEDIERWWLDGYGIRNSRRRSLPCAPGPPVDRVQKYTVVFQLWRLDTSFCMSFPLHTAFVLPHEATARTNAM